MNTAQMLSAMRESGMDQTKQQFLALIMQQMDGKNQNDMLPAMLTAVNLARQKHISFSDQEISTFTKIVTQEMSPVETQRWNMVQNMMRGMRSGN